MSKSVIKEAKTVDEAIQMALSELEIDLEDADVEILEEGSKAVLGFIGGKGAKVKVTANISDSKIVAAFLDEIIKRSRSEDDYPKYEFFESIKNDEKVIEFVKNNIDLIWKQNPVYQHGDFHPCNLIYMDDGKIGVIDFNRWEVGDPYEEFYKLEGFGIEVSIPYSIGQIDAYFDDEIPNDFWGALAVYCAHAALFSIKWAEQFGQDDIDGMVDRCYRAFENYDNFNAIVPKWYDADLKKKYMR